MNCNYNLTKDRVERAIAEINPNPSRWGQGIPSPESAQTILAALDAVRWRDVSEHPKDGEDVLAMMKADWICVVTFRASDNAYLGAFDCNETDDIKGWIPYPVWEE